MLKSIVTLLLLLLGGLTYSQYAMFGSASKIVSTTSCSGISDCYQITPNTGGQVGSVWSRQTLDLSLPFDGKFCVYLGSPNTSATCFNDMEDNGADGMVIVFKGLSASNTGTQGQGSMLGIAGIIPSVGIELDTYPSGVAFGDSIVTDHTALVINGVVANPIKGPIPLKVGGVNAEDGNYHIVRITWNPTTYLMEMYFDGVLRFSHTQNLVTTVFGGNSLVQVGAVGTTGGCSNLQIVCFPLLQMNLPDQILCPNDSAKVSYFHESLHNYKWTSPQGDTISYWDSSFSNALVDTSIFVKEPGNYTLRVMSNSDTLYDTILVTLLPLPIINLGEDTTLCRDSSLVLSAQNPSASYLWNTGGTTQTLVVSDSNEYWVEVTDSNGCVNSDTMLVDIQKGRVDISADIQTGCEPLLVKFGERAIVYNGSVSGYYWDFGNSNHSLSPQDSSMYASAGTYSIQLSVVSNLGCVFDSLFTNFVEVYPYAIANFDVAPSVGKENSQNYFTNLSINSMSWFWDFGDGSTSSLENPIKVFTSSGKYSIKLVASNAGGCNDSIVKEFDVVQSPSFFAPNSFTPNDDGINDEWRINGVEFTTGYQIQIFNCWGDLLFFSIDKTQSWDGTSKGEIVPEGIYSYRTVLKYESDTYEYFGHILVGR